MLQGPPDENQLSRMYFELSQIGANCSGENLPWPYQPKTKEELLALAAEMSRYDPRLLGILVEYFVGHWKEISPQNLRSFYRQMETPQTVAVVAEFSKEAVDDREGRYLAEYLQRGLKPVPPQWYFRNLYTPGGTFAKDAAEENLAQYQRWGFFAREYPTVDVFKKTPVGRMAPPGRRNLIRRLFEKKKFLSIGEYLAALGNTISRQQAIQDLRKIAKLRKGAKGRGAKWVLK